jgi:lipooligosaccharide transport system ATP-binding protein
MPGGNAITMTDLIEADGLAKTFGSLRAVDGITFRVRRGECFGLLGPNGAGKTTTIRMLYGFTPRSGGRLRIFGQECDGDWRAIKAKIGVCQQENNLDPDLSVRQNLEVFAGYFNLPAARVGERVDHLLRFTALDHRGGAEVRELSGGMMRRLVLARALLNEPELLILDEPTTGLDPQSRHQLWNRLEELKREGLTILLTTHYMDEAERLCDRLLIMDDGRILVEGSPRELILAHVGQEVIEVVAPGDDLRAHLTTTGVAFEDLGHRLIVYGGNGEGFYQNLVREFCREGCMLRPATLEDVFLRLTGRELRE